MSNPISQQIATGTIGELLVQLRLLQHGVQSAAPLKDSGNDLIAVRGEAFRSIQVKTSTKGVPGFGRLPNHFHIVALVALVGEGNELHLDASAIYLLPREDILDGAFNNGPFERYRITQDMVDRLFSSREGDRSADAAVVERGGIRRGSVVSGGGAALKKRARQAERPGGLSLRR